jgi:twitching motility protein PilT
MSFFDQLCDLALRDSSTISDFFVLAPLPGKTTYLIYEQEGILIHNHSIVVTEEDFENLLERIAAPSDLSALQTFEAAADAGGGIRFRIIGTKTLGRWRIILRLLPSLIRSPDELLIPPQIVELFLQLRHGMILVTGTTGSGKSTTLASLLREKAMNEASHFITLEDPIEYILGPYFESGSIFTQRQVGRDHDVASFALGLRQALRMAPKVIFVGEIRDEETAIAAVQAAETGHLVVATLHTGHVSETVQRYLKLVQPERMQSVQDMMSTILRAVVCQRLVRIDDEMGGRVAIHEVMVSTPSIGAHISRGNWMGIDQDLEVGRADGHLTFAHSLDKRVKEGIITSARASVLLKQIT